MLSIFNYNNILCNDVDYVFLHSCMYTNSNILELLISHCKYFNLPLALSPSAKPFGHLLINVNDIYYKSLMNACTYGGSITFKWLIKYGECNNNISFNLL